MQQANSYMIESTGHPLATFGNITSKFIIAGDWLISEKFSI